MLEKPRISDEQIVAFVQVAYGMSITDLQFLPIGYDAQASVYRATRQDGSAYFLKLRHQLTYKAGGLITHYLSTHGLSEVVAPLPTRNGALWAEIEDYTLLLYPFVEGVVGMDAGLSDSQWIAFGDCLRRLHATRLPPELLSRINRDVFIPKWSRLVWHLQTQIQQNEYTDLHEQVLSDEWRARHEQISRLVARCETLGRMLSAQRPEMVVCHADIHTANVLLDADGNLHIVDWDGLILAPRERDLMFVADEARFFEGYTNVKIDLLALAYYRYEWVVQEIGDFGERVFLTPGNSDAIKSDSVDGFRALFAPGDVVEQALEADML